jgi:oligopeptide/dipeptide ABC transporter ATP-binding protein
VIAGPGIAAVDAERGVVVGAATLSVENLRVSYPGRDGRVAAVDGISFDVAPGEILGLVGESGSGKSTTALAILRLIRPPGLVEEGRAFLDGTDLLTVHDRELQRLRWSRVAFIPQGSMNSLNPVMRSGDQIADAIVAHEGRTDRAALRLRVAALLESVRLRPDVAGRYPHELSGGMRQRVCIAMATALGPRLLIADEPTSALDVVVQRAVAETLLEATERLGASLLLIGHDLALQAQMVARLAVMRAGRLVELGPVRAVFREPAHPYTRALMAAVPSIRDPHGTRHRSWPAAPVDPSRCLLGDACVQRGATAGEARPLMHEIAIGHLVACSLGERGRGNGALDAHG